MDGERLAEIRERYNSRDIPGHNRCICADIPWLLAEVERLEQRNRLEHAVVEAAVARRAARLAASYNGVYEYYCVVFDAEVNAVDSLVAFRKEKGEVRA